MPELPRHAYAIPTMEAGWDDLPTVAQYLAAVIGRPVADLPRELRAFLELLRSLPRPRHRARLEGELRPGA